MKAVFSILAALVLASSAASARQASAPGLLIDHQSSDSRRWVMDGESGGKLEPFARVTLTRKKQARACGASVPQSRWASTNR
jgi:hypothetical protein